MTGTTDLNRSYRRPADEAAAATWQVGSFIPSAKLSPGELTPDRYYFDITEQDAKGRRIEDEMRAVLAALGAPVTLVDQSVETLREAGSISFLGAELVSGVLSYRIYFGFDGPFVAAGRDALAYQWEPGGDGYSTRTYERVGEVPSERTRDLIAEVLDDGVPAQQAVADLVERILGKATAPLHLTRVRGTEGGRHSLAFNFHRSAPVHGRDIPDILDALARTLSLPVDLYHRWRAATDGLWLVDVAVGMSDRAPFVTIYHGSLDSPPPLLAIGSADAMAQPAEPEPMGPPVDPAGASTAAGESHLRALAPLTDLTAGTADVRVAVIDGPVDLSHPCFQGASLRRVDIGLTEPDDRGAAMVHGTQVASVLFGQPGSDVQGVAPGCTGILLAALESTADGQARGNQVALAQAVGHAIDQRADIICISSSDPSAEGQPEPILATALDRCAANGILVVAATGNDGASRATAPASHPGVLAVGAADSGGMPLSSNTGGPAFATHGLLAHGSNLPVAQPGGGRSLVSGTSFAAAVTAGAAALLLSLARANGSTATGKEIGRILVETARPCPTGTDHRCFGGLLDTGSALDRLGIPVGPSAPLQSIPLQNPLAKKESLMTDTSSQLAATETGPQQTLAAAATPAPVPPSPQAPAAPAAGDCGCQGGNSTKLVYALGTIGVDFGSESRRDSFAQAMGGIPEDMKALLAYLDENPEEAERLTWTLNLDETPIYAIVPVGPFAGRTYDRLREFLRDQLAGGIERVSVPGESSGGRRLASGQKVPSLLPVLRGMYSWNTPELVRSLVDVAKEPEAGTRLQSFLQHAYHELRNTGASSQDRAINAAATHAMQALTVFRETAAQGLELDSVTAERSPAAKPGADTWDVILTFFSPTQRLERARKLYRITVDVSDVLPIMVGQVRSWSKY